MSGEMEEIRRQARIYLESLRQAGINWLARESLEVAQESKDNAATLPVIQLDSDGNQLRQEGNRESREERAGQLAELAREVARCQRCPHLAATRTQTVFGVGPLDAELCFIGEGPGADEDARGEPFVGLAGQLLNKIIVAMGMRREEVYICNILRCRPPGNRTPNAEEAANCREYLEKTLQLVRPRTICCLGACAAQNLLGSTQSIGKMRGLILDYQGTPVFATYHPAYLLRYPEEKKKVWEDMKKLMKHLGRPVG